MDKDKHTNDELSKDIKVELLKDLTERLKLRHTFIWSIFFKMLIFYFTIITSPILFYFQLKPNDFTNLTYKFSIMTSTFKLDILEIITLVFSSIVLVFVFWSIGKVAKWIMSEENRQKIVLERAREIYNNDFNIDLKKGLINYNPKVGIMSLVIGLFKFSVISYAVIAFLGLTIFFLSA